MAAGKYTGHDRADVINGLQDMVQGPPQDLDALQTIAAGILHVLERLDEVEAAVNRGGRPKRQGLRD